MEEQVKDIEKESSFWWEESQERKGWCLVNQVKKEFQGRGRDRLCQLLQISQVRRMQRIDHLI